MATQLTDRNRGHRLHGSPGRPGVNSNVRLVRGSTSSAPYFTSLNSNKRTLATNTEIPGAIAVDHRERKPTARAAGAAAVSGAVTVINICRSPWWNLSVSNCVALADS
jgi:hypothetical protein